MISLPPHHPKPFLGPQSTIPSPSSPKTSSPSSHQAPALFARTFGYYTLVSGMLRLIAAHNLLS
ncbi:predicted protein [Botrytis cinerea T4]|uniref:Uncharacterized protein n=1 Tax=Botryotinia fuckeliana (strain T4) TaxID=999810 RepID=G2YDV7_BOTF4|nr:predicted protein [Botrytis cinerea T4]